MCECTCLTVRRFQTLSREERGAAEAWIERRGFAVNDVWLVEVKRREAIVHTYLRDAEGHIKVNEAGTDAATAQTRVPIRRDPPPWQAANLATL